MKLPPTEFELITPQQQFQPVIGKPTEYDDDIPF